MAALSTIAIVGATAAAAGTAYQVDRGMAASRQQRRASERQKEARAVSVAQQERERQMAIRQQQRQERIRRAQIVSAAEASGVSGSSVEASTIGAGQTIAQAGQAFATGASMSSRQVSSLTQQAADYRSKAAFDLAQGQVGGALAGIGSSAFMAAGGFSAFE
jgi:hypothetical protein